LTFIIKKFIWCRGAEPQFKCEVQNRAPEGAEVQNRQAGAGAHHWLKACRNVSQKWCK